ncbi:MAG: ATP-binding cassette domain-containing protein [Paracoccus sp. (in: a-proteobacteria)]
MARHFGGVQVIRDLSLQLAAGERLVILGPNGAGKTTLLRLIAGEIQPDAGRMTLAGRDISRLPVEARAQAGLGRGFQQGALFEGFTLRENLILAEAPRRGPMRLGRAPLRSPDLNARAEDLAARVGLRDLERRAALVDHGSRRRLDLALALAGAPGLVLLDEPASGFGPGGAAEIHALIAGLPRDISLIVIEHDLDLAFAIADRIVILNAGAKVFDGAPEDAKPALKAIYDA